MKNFLKKKILILVLLFFIFSFISVNYASASVSLTALPVYDNASESYSVKLDATGFKLTDGSVFVFILDDDTHNETNHNYDIYTVGNNDTTAETTFTNLTLTPGKSYTAYLYSDNDWDYTNNILYSNPIPIVLASASFSAPGTLTVSTPIFDDTSKTYSIKLDAAGLTINKTYIFQIKDNNVLHSDTEKSVDGTLTHTFTDLSLTSGKSYTALVWDANNLNAALATKDFIAPGSIILKYLPSSLVYNSDSGTYSIALQATNVTPGQQYVFKIEDDQKVITSATQEAVSDTLTDNSTFNDLTLTSGTSYTASISSIDDSSTASTFFVAPTGAGGGGGGGGNETHTISTGSLVPCGTQRYPAGTYRKSDGVTVCSDPKVAGCFDFSGQINRANMCTFNDLLVLVNNVVKFVFVALVVPIAAIAFAYAGFLLIFSGGDTSKREKAKKIFWGVVWGLVIAAAAWLIVHVVLQILGFSSSNAFGL